MSNDFFSQKDARQIIEQCGIQPPARVTKKYLRELAQEGKISYFYGGYDELVKSIEALPLSGQIILLNEKFVFGGKEASRRLKSLDDLVKIDSRQVLKSLAEPKEAPERLTKEFLETFQILPQYLAEEAFDLKRDHTQPRGIYWIDLNNTANVITWLNAVEGLHMKLLHDKGGFDLRVVDTKPYGSNIRVSVSSRQEENIEYQFLLNRLPLHYQDDISRFSSWISIQHTSNDLDATYIGGEHDKRKNPINYWSATAIAGFYEAISFINQEGSKKRIKINPFPIPKDRKMIEYIEKSKTSILIAAPNKEGEVEVRGPNKGEVEKLIGARVERMGYSPCWKYGGETNQK